MCLADDSLIMLWGRREVPASSDGQVGSRNLHASE